MHKILAVNFVKATQKGQFLQMMISIFVMIEQANNQAVSLRNAYRGIDTALWIKVYEVSNMRFLFKQIYLSLLKKLYSKKNIFLNI
ncbi:MAG: hypothetical protein LBU09_02800 [Endomicrobium sp.]|nr:hypothetical protein [Endomicrobium sp.]